MEWGSPDFQQSMVWTGLHVNHSVESNESGAHRLAGLFVKPMFWEPLVALQDPLAGLHANTHLAQVCILPSSSSPPPPPSAHHPTHLSLTAVKVHKRAQEVNVVFLEDFQGSIVRFCGNSFTHYHSSSATGCFKVIAWSLQRCKKVHMHCSYLVCIQWPLNTMHEYTLWVLQVNGFAAQYEQTGDKDALTAVQHFFDVVTHHHSYATGGMHRLLHALSTCLHA